MLAEPRDLKIDNLTNLAGGQTLEDDHGVNSIEKLRAKHPLQFLVDLLFRVLVAPLDLIGLVHDRGLESERGAGLVDVADAQVGGHDDYGVREVDHLALRIAEPAVLQDLQQHIEDLGMRLLYLVQEDHGVRPAAYSLGQLAAFVIANIARR